MDNLNNLTYILDFARKHNFVNEANLIFNDDVKNIDTIKSIVFSLNDLDYGEEINIGDIRFDIDTNLPDDVFEQWIEYNKTNSVKVSYVDWVTKMNNHYMPKNIDKSGSIELQNELNNIINVLSTTNLVGTLEEDEDSDSDLDFEDE